MKRLLLVFMFFLLSCSKQSSNLIESTVYKPYINTNTLVELTPNEVNTIQEILIDYDYNLVKYILFQQQHTKLFTRPVIPSICYQSHYDKFLNWLTKNNIDYSYCEYMNYNDILFVSDIMLPNDGIVILLQGEKKYYTKTMVSYMISKKKYLHALGYFVLRYYDEDIEEIMDNGFLHTEFFHYIGQDSWK